MEINEKILTHYIPYMAKAQITENYSNMGYVVYKEIKIGEFRPDLVMRKGSEYIVFEIKTRKLSKRKKLKIQTISEYVNSQENYKFKLVFANAPKDKSLKIEGIEEILVHYMIDHTPEDILELGTHCVVDEVSDIELDWVEISQFGAIKVQGFGIISVILQYGSSGDLRRGDAVETYQSFPFNFDAIIELSYLKEGQLLRLSEMNELVINTEAF